MKLIYNMRKTEEPNVAVVMALKGCLDSETAPEFGKVMDLLLGRHRCPLIVDMANVVYISSAGWREFVTKTEDIIERRINIRIAGMQPTVRDVFELIGLDHVYETHETVEEAVEALKASSPS